MHYGGEGGTLQALGEASVSNDSVVLHAGSLLPSTLALYFQGDAREALGLGSRSSDGILCASGAVIRLGTRTQMQGSSLFGYETGSPLVSVKGQVPPAGATRYYQVAYRDPHNYCTPGTLNYTNGVRIDWTP